MNGKDILFLLKPSFTDGDSRWFCPYCAQLAGYLSWYPVVRETLDVREVAFRRPRQEIVELIGPDHQSCPVLVLAPHAPLTDLPLEVLAHGETRFISRTLDILRYLAATRGTPLPH